MPTVRFIFVLIPLGCPGQAGHHLWQFCGGLLAGVAEGMEAWKVRTKSQQYFGQNKPHCRWPSKQFKSSFITNPALPVTCGPGRPCPPAAGSRWAAFTLRGLQGVRAGAPSFCRWKPGPGEESVQLLAHVSAPSSRLQGSLGQGLCFGSLKT